MHYKFNFSTLVSTFGIHNPYAIPGHLATGNRALGPVLLSTDQPTMPLQGFTLYSVIFVSNEYYIYHAKLLIKYTISPIQSNLSLTCSALRGCRSTLPLCIYSSKYKAFYQIRLATKGCQI